MLGNIRKLSVVSLIALLTLIIAAWTKPAGDDNINLKVLPKNISSDSLSLIMDEFTAALNVDCVFCHAPKEPETPKKLNYASDVNHLKDITRTMMRMTYEMNAKYMKTVSQKNTQLVTCNTCHRGKPVPEQK